MTGDPVYGYIGLGMMGGAMAERLLSTGAAVHVFDLAADAVSRAVDRGAVAAGSAADVAAAADVVGICVPAGEHVDAVLRGGRGIGHGAKPGQTVLLHSTVHPDTVRSAAATAAEWGVAVHDACVAGGDDAARAGELVLFAGGYDEMSPDAVALLDVYGSRVIAAGPVGAGAALKIAVNVMTYAQQAAACTAFALASGAGAGTDALVDAWRHTGQLGALTERYLGLLAVPTDEVTGDLRAYLEGVASIAVKDLDLAIALGDADTEQDPLAGVVRSLRDAMPRVMGVHHG